MVKKDKYYSEEQQEIRSFIKILIGLVLIFLVLYFLSNKFVGNDNNIKRTNQSGKVQYDSISIGTLLNRADNEYYVLVFDSEDLNNSYIVNKASSYKSNHDSKPLYSADLSLEFNKKFVSDESFYRKDTLDGIKFKGTTLVFVKDKHIIKFIESSDDIDKELSKKES